MLFSIIVPFLNEEDYLPLTIPSLLNQDIGKEHFEVILVDNGSTDSSRQIVSQFDEIMLLSEPVKDPYIARNRGIQQACGDYIALIDADCLAESNWLSSLHTAIEKTNADILLGALLYPNTAGQLAKYHEAYYNSQIDYIFKTQLSECYFGHGGNMAIKQSIFSKVGLFQGMPIVGDTAIIHDLLTINPDAIIVYSPEAKVTHLEITQFSDLLKKCYGYGKFSATLTQESQWRPLSVEERRASLKHCFQEKRWNLIEQAICSVSLKIGEVAFRLGWRSGLQ